MLLVALCFAGKLKWRFIVVHIINLFKSFPSISCVKDLLCFFVLFAVRVEVEMELVVENYVFTEELKNKSTPAYKETEKNFTTEVNKFFW